MYSSTHSVASALDGGEWSVSRSGRFILREKRLRGPQSRSGLNSSEALKLFDGRVVCEVVISLPSVRMLSALNAAHRQMCQKHS